MTNDSRERRVAAGAIPHLTTLTMDPAERIQAASNFLLQSPPGEINDVLNGAFL